jgi:single-strand DNA-binding protein
MPALNRVQLIGNLGRDPEARFTANGKKYAVFSIAVNRTWKSAEGEKQQATDWFLVNAWGKLGETCLEYLKKGRLVFVEGRLRSERWEDKESGEPHSRTVVVALNMQWLDRKPDEAEVVAEDEEAAAE